MKAKMKSRALLAVFLTLTVAIVFSTLSIAEAAPQEPETGTDDCYNRATETCNRKHPGRNWGDKAYRDCINDHLDWCDENEPTTIDLRFPVLNSEGRFVKAPSRQDVEAGTINININLKTVK
jgi:hypothetical protein